MKQGKLKDEMKVTAMVTMMGIQKGIKKDTMQQFVNQRKNNLLKFLAAFCFSFLVLFPAALDVPVKSREHSGIVTQNQETELLCIKSALYHEARGEPEEGIRAVMSVIYNRKNSKHYPDTFCGVILQERQFSAFNEDKSLATKRLKPVREADIAAYTKVAGIAQEALLGTFKPVLDPSVMHYAHFSVKNHWTKKYKKVKVAGKHVFYRKG